MLYFLYLRDMNGVLRMHSTPYRSFAVATALGNHAVRSSRGVIVDFQVDVVDLHCRGGRESMTPITLDILHDQCAKLERAFPGCSVFSDRRLAVDPQFFFIQVRENHAPSSRGALARFTSVEHILQASVAAALGTPAVNVEARNLLGGRFGLWAGCIAWNEKALAAFAETVTALGYRAVVHPEAQNRSCPHQLVVSLPSARLEG